jgi:hypothetical protein
MLRARSSGPWRVIDDARAAGLEQSHGGAVAVREMDDALR